jgi:hypothetical protein
MYGILCIPQKLQRFQRQTTFTDTERMVLTLVKSLLKAHPPETKFRIALDNFFTSYMYMNKTDLGVWLCSLDDVAMLLNA